jgi:hypothetical protein
MACPQLRRALGADEAASGPRNDLLVLCARPVWVSGTDGTPTQAGLVPNQAALDYVMFGLPTSPDTSSFHASGRFRASNLF